MSDEGYLFSNMPVTTHYSTLLLVFRTTELKTQRLKRRNKQVCGATCGTTLLQQQEKDTLFNSQGEYKVKVFSFHYEFAVYLDAANKLSTREMNKDRTFRA